MADYTNDQLAAMLQMQDLSGMEKNMARQQAMTNALRQQALQPSRRDWASQLSQALMGGMAAYGMRRDDQAMKDYSQAKNDNMSKVMSMLTGRQPLSPTAQSLPPAAPAPAPTPVGPQMAGAGATAPQVPQVPPQMPPMQRGPGTPFPTGPDYPSF